MKIELKHLAPYLPYGLNIGYFFEGKMICKLPMVASMIGNSFAKEIPINTILENDGSCKPILRPLSDLTKEIEHNGERFIPNEIIKSCNPNFYYYKRGNCIVKNTKTCVIEYEYGSYPFWLIELMCEWHIDFQDLISQGLAIDVNTLK